MSVRSNTSVATKFRKLNAKEWIGMLSLVFAGSALIRLAVMSLAKKFFDPHIDASVESAFFWGLGWVLIIGGTYWLMSRKSQM